MGKLAIGQKLCDLGGVCPHDEALMVRSAVSQWSDQRQRDVPTVARAQDSQIVVLKYPVLAKSNA